MAKIKCSFETNSAIRSPQTPRSRRQSSTSLISGNENHAQMSVTKLFEERRAKKIRFYRNGDRFYNGKVIAVSPGRFRTFESLLADLTCSSICDKNVMPQGVRHIFNVDGSHKITSLDELKEGESYVCATADVFKPLCYTYQNKTPNWKNSQRSAVVSPLLSSSIKETNWYNNLKKDQHNKFSLLSENGNQNEFNEQEVDLSCVHPKLITVIKNGSKPRKAVRVLLNQRTAHNFDQILTEITSAIRLDSGAVRKMYTTTGQEVTRLSDFFKDDDKIFIACGQEKLTADDFIIQDNEVRNVSVYRTSFNKVGQKMYQMSSDIDADSFVSTHTSVNENGHDNFTGVSDIHVK